MGILNLKKKKALVGEPETKKEEKPKVSRKLVVSVDKNSEVRHAALSPDARGPIVRPKVTEKAAALSQNGRDVHVFEVLRCATKRSVAEAVMFLYKVSPSKVAILKVPAKKSMSRGRVVKGKTGLKAYVYLKKGDKIEAV